ncbi:MAG: putative addiction module antidote protein [bacterium]|nr:putative addiction module antidote protein [bacterium]
MTRKASRPFKEIGLELLKDPERAALYLEECLADGDMELFKLALKNVADARLGGMSALAEKTNLGRESLYKSLSKAGNPKLETLEKILSAIGLRFSIVPETGPRGDEIL